MNKCLVYFVIILIALPAFAAANSYEFRKEYSGNVIDGMREMVFANTTISMSRGDYFKFQFKPGGKYYNYTLFSADGENVTFLMPLNRQVTVAKGELKNVDSDADGNDDLGIYIFKAYVNGGAIVFSPIAGQSSGGTIKDLSSAEQENNDTAASIPEETAPSQANESQLPVDAETKKKVAAWPVVIGIILFGCVTAAIFIVRRARNNF